MVTRRELLGVAVGALGFVMFMCSVPFDERGDEPDVQRFAAAATPPAVLLIAGDIARCGFGDDDRTALVLDSLVGVHPDAIVVPLGDLVYPNGSAANFRDCYTPSWGRHKTRSKPVLGNHEYDASATATPYFDYFGGLAGPRGRGYYTFDPHPAWHVLVLNTNSRFISTAASSTQGQWLKADLEANAKVCVLALFHHPRFYSMATGPFLALSGYTSYPWQQLTAVKADLAVNASQHFYERFAKQLPDGTASPVGMRQFIVGTGGASGSPPLNAVRPNSEVRNPNARGVLKLELGEGWYSWRFVSIAGRTYADSGREDCHEVPVSEPPDTLPEEPPVDTLPSDSAPPPVDTLPEDTTPPPPPAPTIRLTVVGRTDATKQYMTLDWTGASGTNVDVYRSGPLLTATPNDGHYVNSRALPGSPSYTYKVCQTGSGVCSNEVTVTFP